MRRSRLRPAGSSGYRHRCGRATDVFYQLTFLAITFFVTGAICLGGALMRIPQYDDAKIKAQIEHDFNWQRKTLEGVDKRLTKEIAVLRQDSGEGRGELQRELNIWESQHRELEAKVAEQLKLIIAVDKDMKKIGDDLYRHFSLNMKKPKGERR
jgi:hypothetical protein